MAFQAEVMWRRVDERGEERCLFACADACVAQGIGAQAFNGSGMMFEYRLEYSHDGVTQNAAIIANVGVQEHRVRLERFAGGWIVDGAHDSAYDSCTDIDLSFSPSANTLTIRRLTLGVGQEADSRALLVSEPTLALSILDQHYTRLSETSYRYEAAGFSAELLVDSEGLVLSYPGRFEALATASMG